MNLESLSKFGDFFLFDTCVFISSFGDSNKKKFRNDSPFEEKIKFLKDNSEFLENLSYYLNNSNNFFTTSLIIDELTSGSNYPYRKLVKRDGGLISGFGNPRELLEFRRALNIEKKSRRKVINSFYEKGKILVLDERAKKVYNNLYERYSYFKKNLGDAKGMNLSEADYDFLLKGIVISRLNKFARIRFVSNDIGIFRAMNKIFQERYVSINKIKYLIRKDTFEFSVFN